MNNILPSISPQIRERLAFIDFFAFFLGRVGRKELCDRFGISAPAATRDFRLYNEIAPNNLIYKPKERAYVKSKNFTLITQLSIEKCLNTINHGFGDFAYVENLLQISETARLGTPDINTLAVVTTALYTKQPINIGYFSTTSGNSDRIIVPHTLVDTGMRWHVRAFCRQQNQFRDFVINRISTISLNVANKVLTHETKDNDTEWSEVISLDVRPHPKLAHQTKAIELDYAMNQGKLMIQSRLATASYLLSGWNIDCTCDQSMKGSQYHLYLHNHQDIFATYGDKLFIQR